LNLSRELCDLQENPRVIAKGATKWDTKGRCCTPLCKILQCWSSTL